MLSATAAWSTLADPTQLLEPFDEAGVPLALYAYSPREAAYNAAHAEPPECCAESLGCSAERRYCACAEGVDCSARIALWPGAALPTDAGTVIGLYEKVKVGSGAWDFDVLGIGTATVATGDVVARRTTDAGGEPILLFDRGEPKFLHAMRVNDERGAWVYVFGETSGPSCSLDVFLARAPLAEMRERTAYRFWDGVGWSESLASARAVLNGVEGGLGSVAYNDYLGAYVSGTIGLCTDGAHFLMRSARRPEGPWSDPVAVDLATLGASGEAYAGLIHASLGTGRRVVISFYEPVVCDERAVGRVHLAQIELRRRRVGMRPRIR